MNEPTVRVLSSDYNAMSRWGQICCLPPQARREAFAEWEREQKLERTWQRQTDVTLGATPYSSRIDSYLLPR